MEGEDSNPTATAVAAEATETSVIAATNASDTVTKKEKKGKETEAATGTSKKLISDAAADVADEGKERENMEVNEGKEVEEGKAKEGKEGEEEKEGEKGEEAEEGKVEEEGENVKEVEVKEIVEEEQVDAKDEGEKKTVSKPETRKKSVGFADVKVLIEEDASVGDEDDEDSLINLNLDDLSEEEILKILANNGVDGDAEDYESVVSYDDEGHRSEGRMFPAFLYSPPEPIPLTPFEKFMFHFKRCSLSSDRARNYAAHLVLQLSLMAARRPRITIMSVVSFTIAMVISVPFFGGDPGTWLNTDFEVLFCPIGTQTATLSEWYRIAIVNPRDPAVDRFLPYPDGLFDDDKNTNDGGRRSRRVLLEEEEGLQHAYHPSVTVHSPPLIFDNMNSSNIEENHSVDFYDERNGRKLQGGPIDNQHIISILVHSGGENVVSLEALNRVKEVQELILSSSGYNTFCEGGLYERTNNCNILDVTTLWRNGIQNTDSDPKTEAEFIERINRPFDLDKNVIIGNLGFENGAKTLANSDGTNIIYGQALSTALVVNFSNQDMALFIQFEKGIIETLKGIKQSWSEDDSIYTLESMSTLRITRDLIQSILNDIPLVMAVFFVMIAFTAIVFSKCDNVRSRSLLGLGGIFTICCSISTGAAFMLLLGYPFTPMTMVMPFLMFGVGLDDTFVIVGEYNRTSENDDVLARIHHTMEEVAVSIITTTLTTTLSFIFGISCTIPAIKYLCYWCAPMIVIDFFYQITMFVALIVLDEGRIKQNRMDCIVCVIVGRNEIVTGGRRKVMTVAPERRKTMDKDPATRFMRWYGNQLMKPLVRKAVLFIFGTAFLYLGWQMLQMEVKFTPTALLPKDSVVLGYAGASSQYTIRFVRTDIAFRYVDQMDSEVQEQMLDFIQDITDIPGFGEEPPVCWLTLYKKELDKNAMFAQFFKGMNMGEQLEMIKANSPELYSQIEPLVGQFARRNDEGKLVMSLCTIFVNEIDMESSNAQTELLDRIRKVEDEHPMNQGRSKEEYAFFTNGTEWYPIWELFKRTIPELCMTVVGAVGAVGVVGFFIIPHWSGMLFILPIIVMLLVDLIGIMHLMDITINPISYIALVIAIGLMVDYIVHILIRYYESIFVEPIERVKDTLETMGAAILTGGLSTFLGFVPMLFSKSEIFLIVARTIISMVAISLLHGLVLLPVVLSYLGPTETQIASKGFAQV